jgi:hypothetical protein
MLVPVLRWSARITGSLLVLLFALFSLGEGLPDPALLSASQLLMFASMTVALLGMVAGWHSDEIGGILIVSGKLVFDLVNVVTTGHVAGGPIFPIVWVPGILFLLAAWRDRSSTLGQHVAQH